MAIPGAMQMITVDDNIHLELINDQHAAPLLDLVNKNRQHLRQWLPWVDGMQTVENFQAYINCCKMQHEEDTDYGYVIFFNNTIAGRIGIHYIHQYNNLGAIGYWLGEEFSGKGIITKACKALITHCFKDLGLNRIEIKCAADNRKSAATAERLDFKKEGVLRQAELVNEEYLDLHLYAMLKEEWK
jgi:ribosomal-protein-serine acetyltransferase